MIPPKTAHIIAQEMPPDKTLDRASVLSLALGERTGAPRRVLF
jgi:hypothetical protein